MGCCCVFRCAMCGVVVCLGVPCGGVVVCLGVPCGVLLCV